MLSTASMYYILPRRTPSYELGWEVKAMFKKKRKHIRICWIALCMNLLIRPRSRKRPLLIASATKTDTVVSSLRLLSDNLNTNIIYFTGIERSFQESSMGLTVRRQRLHYIKTLPCHTPFNLAPESTNKATDTQNFWKPMYLHAVRA